MTKNDLTIIFSQVCQHLADNIADILISHLGEDDLMITPLFKDAHIFDIDEWWLHNDHLAKYITQMHSLEHDALHSMQENIDNGIVEIQESETLWNEFCALDDGTEEAQLKALQYIPHNASYASELMETEGYKNLDYVCKEIGCVVAWPMVTIDTNSTDLKSAFYLNVTIVSTDNNPLRAKLESFQKLIF